MSEENVENPGEKMINSYDNELKKKIEMVKAVQENTKKIKNNSISIENCNFSIKTNNEQINACRCEIEREINNINYIREEIVQLEKKNIYIEGKKRGIEQENIRLEKEYNKYQLEIQKNKMPDSDEIVKYLEKIKKNDEITKSTAYWLLGFVLLALSVVGSYNVKFKEFGIVEAVILALLFISFLLSLSIARWW